MLAAIRAFAKSPVAWVIFGALMLSFAFLGSSQLGNGAALNLGSWVIKSGSRTVEKPEFKREFDDFLKQKQEEVHQTISLEQAVQLGADRAVLNQLAERDAISEMLTGLGLRPSNKLIEDQIRKQPAFFNPVTGAFDKKTYTELLQGRLGLTPAQFEAQLREQVAISHFMIGASQGVRVPRVFTAVTATLALEARDGVFFTIDPGTVGNIPVPSDAELQDFLNKNARPLPEFRVLSVVRFSAKAAAPGVKLDPAEVQKKFDFRKDSLSVPEKRSLIELPVKDQAAAAAVAGRMNKGEDPLAIAKSLKIDPVVIEDKPKSAVGDHRVAEAAFALADGQVSGPIQGDLSWAVVKVTGVTPGKAADFAAAKPQIEEEMKTQAAQAAVYAQSQKYDDAHNAGATLNEAAQKAAAPVITMAPVSEQGMGQDGKPVENVDETLLKTAFALPTGGESDIVEAGPGEYFVVRVDKAIPPALPTLAAVKTDLIKYILGQKMDEKLKAKAEELQTRVRHGESLEAVAASVGGKVTHVVGIDRVSGPNHEKDLGKLFLETMIGSKAGEVFIAPVPGKVPTVAIGKVEAVRAGDMGDMARFTESQRQQVSGQYFNELSAPLRDEAMRVTHTKTDLGRARAALGLDAEQIAKLDPKAKTDAKPKK